MCAQLVVGRTRQRVRIPLSASHGKVSTVKKPVMFRCGNCGGVYPSGAYMDKRTFESQGKRVFGLKSKCPFCRTMNDSSNCGMVLSA